jgi:hypothetical protein
MHKKRIFESDRNVKGDLEGTFYYFFPLCNFGIFAFWCLVFGVWLHTACVDYFSHSDYRTVSPALFKISCLRRVDSGSFGTILILF